ncbi:MAG: sulfatase [Pirellulaceae bacterium]
MRSSALLWLCVSCCAATFVVATSARGDERPNFVVIFADDLGYGDLACYGHKSFKTPHLDKMAQQGARLTDFYVPMPYCAPSRATILTGRYPFRHGITGNPSPDGPRPRNDIGIAAEEVTLAEALQEAGYATACIGKWHLGHVPQFMPRKHGFDEYLGILYSNDMRPVQLIENEKVVEYPVVQATLTRRYTERALQFLDKNQDRPFFLYLPHAMPHKPLAASEEFYKRSGAGLYGDVISELDWSVGQVLAKLKELELDEKTLVIFTSDNGPWFGGSSGGLRGMKSRSWDGGLRVPMIARWPGKIPAGQTIGELCGTIDVFPTLLKLADGKPPAGRTIDGRDILPVLTNKAKSPHEALLAMRGADVMTIRDARWKLHLKNPGPSRLLADVENWIDPRGPDGVTLLAPYEQYPPSAYPGAPGGDEPQPMMLFDLNSDPAEQRNVLEQHPDVVARLRNLHDELVK